MIILPGSIKLSICIILCIVETADIKEAGQSWQTVSLYWLSKVVDYSVIHTCWFCETSILFIARKNCWKITKSLMTTIFVLISQSQGVFYPAGP